MRRWLRMPKKSQVVDIRRSGQSPVPPFTSTPTQDGRPDVPSFAVIDRVRNEMLHRVGFFSICCSPRLMAENFYGERRRIRGPPVLPSFPRQPRPAFCAFTSAANRYAEIVEVAIGHAEARLPADAIDWSCRPPVPDHPVRAWPCTRWIRQAAPRAVRVGHFPPSSR